MSIRRSRSRRKGRTGEIRLGKNDEEEMKQKVERIVKKKMKK